MNYLAMVLLGIIIYPIISNVIELIANFIQLQTSKLTVSSCYLQNEINQLEKENIEENSQVIGFQIPDDEEWSDEDYE